MDIQTIRYTRSDVALMVRIALATAPAQLQRKTWETVADLKRMAQSTLRPSASVLRFFDLTEHGSGYQWEVC